MTRFAYAVFAGAIFSTMIVVLALSIDWWLAGRRRAKAQQR